jgi:hypothetical protein
MHSSSMEMHVNVVNAAYISVSLQPTGCAIHEYPGDA